MPDCSPVALLLPGRSGSADRQTQLWLGLHECLDGFGAFRSVRIHASCVENIPTSNNTGRASLKGIQARDCPSLIERERERDKTSSSWKKAFRLATIADRASASNHSVHTGTTWLKIFPTHWIYLAVASG